MTTDAPEVDRENRLRIEAMALRVAEPQGDIAEDDVYLAVRCLLAAVCVGPHRRRVAALLRVPVGAVDPLARRWREAGIWAGGGVVAPWADEECEHADLLLVLDALVGTGEVSVRREGA